MSEPPSEFWIPPEWREQMRRDTELLEAMAPRVIRAAYLRGLATGAGSVILAWTLWTLWT